MDNTQNQSTTPGQSAPADPMAMPAASTTDMGAGMTPSAPADPMAQPAPATGMDSMAGMTPPPPPPPPMPAADPMAMPAAPAGDPMASTMPAAPAAAGPATMDDLMAELRKIEDKLVEMDEKL